MAPGSCLTVAWGDDSSSPHGSHFSALTQMPPGKVRFQGHLRHGRSTLSQEDSRQTMQMTVVTSWWISALETKCLSPFLSFLFFYLIFGVFVLYHLVFLHSPAPSNHHMKCESVYQRPCWPNWKDIWANLKDSQCLQLRWSQHQNIYMAMGCNEWNHIQIIVSPHSKMVPKKMGQLGRLPGHRLSCESVKRTN